MGIAERREREKEQVRTLIVEAARDIVSERGLDALSMRGIADRIEYSAATIYLYFKDKSELLRSVVQEGFQRMGRTMAEELAAAGPEADAREKYWATGRGYVRFALDNPAYFRVMFELPAAAQFDCPVGGDDAAMTGEQPWTSVVGLVQRGIDAGCFRIPDAFRGAVVGWSLVHGLVSLYLSGHLREHIATREAFMELVDDAMHSVYVGWRNEDATVPAVNGSAGRTGPVHETGS